MLDKRRAVLGSEVGTGKTPVAICAAEEIRLEHVDAHTQAFVICPALVKGVWARELSVWAPQAKVQVIKTGKDLIDPTADWVIFSYDLFSKVHLHHSSFGCGD